MFYAGCGREIGEVWGIYLKVCAVFDILAFLKSEIPWKNTRNHVINKVLDSNMNIHYSVGLGREVRKN